MSDLEQRSDPERRRVQEVAMSNYDLTARLAESVYGDDGLLVKNTRIEVTLARVLEISSDTNDQVKRINGTVADLVRYRDTLPSIERDPLIRAVKDHLDDAERTSGRRDARQRGLSTYAVRFGYDALKLALALLMAFIALHLGLPRVGGF